MDLTHGKYLGVDYGDKRTGLAECDLSGQLASGICTISEGGMRKTAERVKKEAESRACKKIIVGLPKNMDGSEGPRADVVKAFAALLSEICEILLQKYAKKCIIVLRIYYNTKSRILKEYFEIFLEILKKVQ